MRISLIAVRCAAALAMVALSTVVASQHQATRPTSRPMNHLAGETSPYLLQHRFNPVDWYPWGEAALRKAAAEDKPIFLSIGYSACHWCHVMEHESFEDSEVAAVLNEHFVCIKVDREERPDLDEIYMAAVQAMTGAGGWPMSVFLTPDREPFFGGTYWPKDDLRGRPGFTRVLEHVQGVWNNERARVGEVSKQLSEHVRTVLAPTAVPDEPTLAMLDRLVAQSAARFDADFGGFGQAPRYAPKFPHASELTVLLRAHRRAGDERALAMAVETLRAMVRGGMYDQVGCGFHRYSVDRLWLVPHFEKMLYDNALLVPVYLEAWQVTGDEEFAQTVRDTLDYLLREMQDPAGGFWSATDADSEGEEGRFFVWTLAEFDAVCGEDAAVARARFGVTAGGNFEEHGGGAGQNVLHVSMSVDDVAEKLDLTAAEVQAALARARTALYAVRKLRVPPLTDDKVLTTWNAMAITALARGYQVLGDERFLDGARGAAEFLLSSMRDDEGRLLRTWRGGKAHLAAYLEDHGFLAVALLDLFESDFDPRWLREAVGLLRSIERHFLDEADGNFFFTADDHEALIARTKSVSESSIPSGIAMATQAFLRCGTSLGDQKMFERGFDALRANHAMLERNPAWCSTLALAAEFALAEPREVVIFADSLADAAPLLEVVRASSSRDFVVLLSHAGNRADLEGLVGTVVAGKTDVDGKPAAYVCRGGVCERPVTTAQALRALLAGE